MAANADKLPTPGNRIWSLAPKSITDWGYALLVLLTVVSVVTGLVKSGSFISVIITIVMVFGLFIALWAFDRMTKSRDRFWKWTGKFAGGVVIVAMVATFVSILTYIAFGQPAWMDAWFRPGYVIEGPTGTGVSLGSRTDEGPARANTVSRFAWFISPALADDQIERDPRFTVTVTWSPNMQARTMIEVSIKRHGQIEGFPPPIKALDAGVGSATIGGLSEGTTYDLQIVARRDGRRSKPQAFRITTNADHHTVAMFDGFVASYTGAMDIKGRPSATSAYVLLTPQQGSTSRTRWVYTGGFADGLPDGIGSLTTDPLDCTEAACGTRCTGTFKHGTVVSASCSLTLDYFQGRSVGSASAILYGDISTYKGSIVGAGSAALLALSKNDRPGPTAHLGPFAVWIHGAGHMRATDTAYVDLYDGTWSFGRFAEGSRIGTNGGVLSGGQDYLHTDCLLSLTPIKGKAIGGFGGRATCVGIEFGEWRDGGAPFRGFSVDRAGSALNLMWFENGHRRRLSPAENLPVRGECRPDLDYGLLSLPHEPSASPWQFSCDANASPFACTLQAREADIAITGTRPLNGVPAFEIFTSGNARGGTTTVTVAGSSFALPPPAKQLSPLNYALLARMCGGNVLRNEEQQQEVSLGGFCPRLGLMFARLYTCGVDVGAQGDGPDGRPLRDPHPALFDADNFVTSTFSDSGKVLEFRPVRFNEGFYTTHDVVGRLTIEIRTGKDCAQVFRQEFPVSKLSWIGYGMGRLVFSKGNTWSPSFFSHGLEGVAEYLDYYRKVPLRNEFRRSSESCYEVTSNIEMIYRFKFSFRGATGVKVYRLVFPTSGLPMENDLTVGRGEDFDVLMEAYQKRLADKNISFVFPQEIGIAFANAGLDVDWRAMAN